MMLLDPYHLGVVYFHTMFNLMNINDSDMSYLLKLWAGTHIGKGVGELMEVQSTVYCHLDN